MSSKKSYGLYKVVSQAHGKWILVHSEWEQNAEENFCYLSDDRMEKHEMHTKFWSKDLKEETSYEIYT